MKWRQEKHVPIIINWINEIEPMNLKSAIFSIKCNEINLLRLLFPQDFRWIIYNIINKRDMETQTEMTVGTKK